jgi:hypothetical protein
MEGQACGCRLPGAGDSVIAGFSQAGDPLAIMAQFTVHEARTYLSRLIAAAVDGGDVVIETGVARRFGAYRGNIAIGAVGEML